MQLSNKRWSDEEFFDMRKEVLSWWPTGKEIDLDEAVEYRKKLPKHKVWADKLEQAKKDEKCLLYVMLGHATVEQTLEHMKFLEQAGADLLMIMPDAYTRKRKYEEAERGVTESIRQGKSLLNGYPMVNHGVKRNRVLTDSVNVPIQLLSCCDEDPRLNHEVTLASGFNGQTMDLHDLIQHCKDYPLDKRIRNTQYANRLTSYYEERGVPVNLNIPANLCGWDPLGMKIVMAILACLLAAEQGARHLDIGVTPTCHLVHDVAGLKQVRALTNEYLHRFGYNDVTVSVACSSWQGDWPRDLYRAASLLSICASISVLGGVDYHMLRSVQEARAIPNKESNLAALRIGQQVIATLGKQRLSESDELKLEQEMIAKEVRAIVDRVIELGQGDIIAGELKAVQTGELDAAFPCWIHVKGKVLPVRDATGAIRYLDHGNLPLPKDVIEYHRQKIAEREKAEKRKADLEMVIEDVVCISR